MSHTKLPWKTEKASGRSFEFYITSDGEGGAIFKAVKPKRYYTDFPKFTDENGEIWTKCSDAAALEVGNYVATKEIKDSIESQEKANAEFIVKACNNHYKLLNALKELVRQVSAEPNGRMSGMADQQKRINWYEETRHFRLIAEEAIKEADK